MFFVTVKQSPMYKQMTLDDFLFGDVSESALISKNETNTRTYCLKEIPSRLVDALDKERLIRKLKEFNLSTDHLREGDRQRLYYSFLIPKKSGGVRRIDAPNIELMDALRNLKALLEVDFGASNLYHTSAFAYIKGRSTLDALKRHTANESRWFGKFDLSNFFGNTTMDFVMKQMAMIYPFCEIIKDPVGKVELEKALELGFLNGGLPQGTPLSPLITNIMMIPIDYTMAKNLREFENNKFVYTRYADDFIISCKFNFKFRAVEDMLIGVLKDFGSPFSFNRDKTRYGSSAGRNFNLGCMITSDNKITIGRAKKKRIEAILHEYASDVVSGNRWQLEDVQVMAGQLSYLRMVEGDVADRIIAYTGNKFGIDIMSEIKTDLR